LFVMVVFALFATLIGVTLLELYVVITIGHAIGVLPTLGLMLLDAALGAWLMHSQGRAVWRRFREDLAAGRAPTRHVLDGALVIAGGAFLITPGFVTDLLGAFLLLPPTRALARRWVVRRLVGRLPRAAASAAGTAGAAFTARRRNAATGDAYDIDGSAVEVRRDETAERELER
jgi:UPF0716 protein FxsA